MSNQVVNSLSSICKLYQMGFYIDSIPSYFIWELALATSCPTMELVRKRLKISIGVMVSSSENKMGNQFHALWEGTIGCKESNVGSSGRSVKFGIGFLSVFCCMCTWIVSLSTIWCLVWEWRLVWRWWLYEDMHQDQGDASHVRAYAYAYGRLFIYRPLALEIEMPIYKSPNHPK